MQGRLHQGRQKLAFCLHSADRPARPAQGDLALFFPLTDPEPEEQLTRDPETQGLSLSGLLLSYLEPGGGSGLQHTTLPSPHVLCA